MGNQEVVGRRLRRNHALLASLPEPISVVSAHTGDGQAQSFWLTHHRTICALAIVAIYFVTFYLIGRL